MKCNRCRNGMRVCLECQGKGKITHYEKIGWEIFGDCMEEKIIECKNCKGNGEEECTTCDGTGIIPDKE